MWPIDYSIDRLCQNQTCDFCGNPEDYDMSLANENVSSDAMINYGITTFDHLIDGMITIFQVLTLDDWTSIMYNYMDSNSTGITVFFFCILVVFGSFFMLNLILAVIMESFENAS